jgi:acetyl-CoA synthetase
VIEKTDSYDELYASFRWRIPETYNLGVDLCDKWVDGSHRTALIYETTGGETREYSFSDLKSWSDRFANALSAKGIDRGDRIGILLPQCPETVVAHLAIYKIGAIAIPLFTQFGTEALEYRLTDAGAKGVITDGENLPKILDIKDQLPELTTIITTEEDPKTFHGFWRLIEQASPQFKPVATAADDPALIIYTSGTTGPPKGALHGHRVLLGHLPGVELPHNFFPRKDDRFWTPADWAWIGGLIDVLFPSLHHGVPVVAHRPRKFDPEEAYHFLAKHRIRNVFMPPTGLKLMRQVPNPKRLGDFNLRSLGSGGETLGEELLEWGKDTFGLTINEFYGQTEANLLVSNCAELMEAKLGSMGRAVPGHTVEVLGEDGSPCKAETIGEIGVRRPDPVMFLGYWKNEEATRLKFNGDWCLTGDIARKDGDGYFWFVGRKDDVIISSGYRIGPAEIEDCLIGHPEVAMAAVIGVPNEVRTEVVKAFIVLKDENAGSVPLVKDIQEFVKTRLAAYEYPREIEFVNELPMTATGKIMRKVLREQNDRASDSSL